MAQSQVALYNLALSTAGLRYTISATSESTVPAKTCELWYEVVRQTILRAAHWNCAKRYSRLTEEAERDTAADWTSTDPEPGFGFSYRLPASMLYARYLTDFQEFVLGYETDRKIISCNTGGSAAADAPILCYTVDVTDVTLWEPDLYMAVAFGLAAHIVVPLSGKRQRALDTMELANQKLREAQAANANEMTRMFQEKAESLQARGYAFTTRTPYFYPFGSVFTGTGAPVI